MNPFLSSDKYKSIPCVVYYRLEPKKKAQRVNYVCFGGMKEKGIHSALRYIAPINLTCVDNSKVDEAAVDFYLKFMKSVITQPDSPKFLFKKVKNTVHFRLESKGLSYYRALYFLTWFRYVHHYPEVIQRLYAGKEENETLDYTFRRFYKIHLECFRGKFYTSSHAASNEMLIYTWGGGGEPISLEKLRANMTRAVKFEMGVQEVFK